MNKSNKQKFNHVKMTGLYQANGTVGHAYTEGEGKC